MQSLDPDRVDHYLEVGELPSSSRPDLHRIAVQEAGSGAGRLPWRGRRQRTGRRHPPHRIGQDRDQHVQRVLRRNPDALRAAGLLYPRTPGRARHTQLGLFVRPDDELVSHADWLTGEYGEPADFRRDFRRRLDREITGSGARGVVFSDEGLFSAGDRTIRRMRRLTRRVAARPGWWSISGVRTTTWSAATSRW